jgi:hypothetical protein
MTSVAESTKRTPFAPRTNPSKPSRLKEVDGFLVLDLPSDRKTVHFTIEDIKQVEDDMDREYIERSMRRRPASS